MCFQGQRGILMPYHQPIRLVGFREQRRSERDGLAVKAAASDAKKSFVIGNRRHSGVTHQVPRARAAGLRSSQCLDERVAFVRRYDVLVDSETGKVHVHELTGQSYWAGIAQR